VLFHEYDFHEVDELRGVLTFGQFTKKLQWLSRQQDVRVVSMGHISDATPHRYLANQRLHGPPRLLSLLPQFARPRYPLIYFSEQGIRNGNERPSLVILLTAFYGSLLLIAGALGFVATGAIFARLPVLASRFLLLLGPIVLMIGSVYTLYDGDFGAKGLMSVVGVLGYCAGTWTAVVFYHRRRMHPIVP
jgi:hypothetical protein